MASSKSTLKPWLIAAGVLLGTGLSMMITFILVLALYHDDWPAVQAEVVTTWIEPSREGGLTWSLKADIFYELDGKRYEKSDFKILHETLREDTENQQSEWRPGKQFTLYVKSNDPNSISLVPDGGREAMAVMLAILTPAAISAVGFPSFFLVRRSRRKKRSISQG